MFDTLYSITITQAAAALRAGELTSAALVRHALEAVRLHDGTLNAMLRVSASALEEAERCDAEAAQGSFRGPLHGIPLVIKDNIDVRGLPTTVASPLFTHAAPAKADAVAVARLRAAGAVIFGKTNLDELAAHVSGRTSCFGPTVNPWHPERRLSPGGSSSGTATAVAAGYCPGGIGTDTGGSIRQPGSFCGLVAVKPTYGVVSRYGVVAFGSSLDQVGPFARSVEDAALALNALSGRDELDCTSQPCDVDFTANLAEGARGMKIGIVPAFMEAAGLAPEVRAKVEEAAAVLQDMGAELVEVELPHAQAAMSAYYVLGPCEAFSNLARFDSVRYGYGDPGHKDLASQYEASRAKGFGPEARRRIMLGSYLLSAGVYDKYYYPAQQVRTLITRDYAAAFEKVDVILSPVAPTTAFKIGEICDPTEMYLADMFTISINIAGNGGMSFPIGLGADKGLPVGVQIIAPPFKDKNMFRAAAALEQHYGPAPVAPDFADGKVGA